METTPAAELDHLRAEAAHLRRVNQELLATVAELRATVEKQQAHIDRLVRMTFGRRSERVTGPTLFGDVPDPDPPPPATAPPVTIGSAGPRRSRSPPTRGRPSGSSGSCNSSRNAA